ALLEFNAEGPFTTLLIESDNFLPSTNRVIEQIEEQFDKHSILIGHSQLNELFILLSGLNEMKLKKKISKLFDSLQKNPSAKIGVGYSVHLMKDIRYSYTTAK